MHYQKKKAAGPVSLRSRRQPPGLRCPWRPPAPAVQHSSRKPCRPLAKRERARRREQTAVEQAQLCPEAVRTRSAGTGKSAVAMLYSWRLLASIFLSTLSRLLASAQQMCGEAGCDRRLIGVRLRRSLAPCTIRIELHQAMSQRARWGLPERARVRWLPHLRAACLCHWNAVARTPRALQFSACARGHGCAIITEERECSGICRPPLGARRDSLVTAEASRLCAEASDAASAAGQAQRRGSVLAQ